jgi:hypothetical protein
VAAVINAPTEVTTATIRPDLTLLNSGFVSIGLPKPPKGPLGRSATCVP